MRLEEKREQKTIVVVIPAYNCAEFLMDAVASVRAQHFSDIPIVIVNDGSTDRTLVLCEKLASEDAFIHVIDQKNGGVSAARNAGIAYALKH